MKKYYHAGQRGHCRDCAHVDRGRGRVSDSGRICHGECTEIRRLELARGTDRHNGVWNNMQCIVSLAGDGLDARWDVAAFVPLTDKVVTS